MGNSPTETWITIEALNFFFGAKMGVSFLTLVAVCEKETFL